VINVDQLKLGVAMAHLNAQMRRYVSELGMGMKTVVREQAGLLQRDLVMSVPPKNRKALEKSIRKEVKDVFEPIYGRSYAIEHGTGWNRKKKMGFSKSTRGDEMIWLGAGPNFLAGIERGMLRDKDNAESLEIIYKHNRGKLGSRWRYIGDRGKQSIKKINRFMLAKGKFNAFVKAQSERVGKLKASFAVAWFWGAAAPKSGSIPAFVIRHIHNGKVKGSYVSDLDNPSRPTFTLTSEAVGVSKEKARSVIINAMRKRARMMEGHIKHLIRLKNAGKWTAPVEE
jgi:hypothetical protein